MSSPNAPEGEPELTNRPTAALPDPSPAGRAGPQLLVHTARQALYTAVGAGVLTFQRAQVVRRRLERAAESDGAGSAPVALLAGVAAQFRSMAVDAAVYLRLAEQAADGVDRAVDAMLDRVEERLPDVPRAALARSRANTRELRRLGATLLGLDIRSDRPAPAEPVG
jgi:hypothetical protein